MNTKDMKNDLFPPVRAKWFRYYLNELFLATNDGDKNTFFFAGTRKKFSFCVGAQKFDGLHHRRFGENSSFFFFRSDRRPISIIV